MPIQLIFILAAIVALGPLSIDMYLPALPRLQSYFHTDAASVQLTLAAYFVGLSLGQLVYGPLSDRFGRRRPMLIGLVGFTIASVGCAFAQSIEALIVWRFAQAMTGCAGMVIGRAMVRDWCEPQDMARVLSLLVLIMGIAPILAPAIGSAVLASGSWPMLFFILTGCGLFCSVLVAAGVDESLPVARRDTEISFMGSLRHYRHVFSHRRFMGYALSGGLAQSGMFAYISTSSFVFMRGFGLNEQQYAVLFGANAFGLILASQLNRNMLRRYPAQQVLQWAIGSYCILAILMTLFAYTGVGGLWGIALPLWGCLSCLGFTFPNSTSAAMAPFGDRAGTASALLGTLQFGIAGLTSAIVGHFSSSHPLPMALTITVCAMAAWLLLRWVRGK